MTTDFSITTEKSKRFSYLVLKGSMTAKNIIEIRRSFDALLKTELLVMLDISSVDMLDSMGVGIIVNFHRLLYSKRGKLAVVCNSPDIRGVLEIADLDKLLPIYHSRKEAEDDFK